MFSEKSFLKSDFFSERYFFTYVANYSQEAHVCIYKYKIPNNHKCRLNLNESNQCGKPLS